MNSNEQWVTVRFASDFFTLSTRYMMEDEDVDKVAEMASEFLKDHYGFDVLLLANDYEIEAD